MNEAGASRNMRVIRRFTEILDGQHYDALDEVLTDDFVQELPQSGERVRGIDNLRAIISNYPGSREVPLHSEGLQVLGEEPRYVMTPTFNLVRVQGLGDSPISVVKSRYPDGSEWWIVALNTMRGERIAKQVTYFAPVFSPPEWRAQWVESL